MHIVARHVFFSSGSELTRALGRFRGKLANNLSHILASHIVRLGHPNYPMAVEKPVECESEAGCGENGNVHLYPDEAIEGHGQLEREKTAKKARGQEDSALKVSDACRPHQISEKTYYRWKQKYGGMDVAEARRLKELEEENARLKRLVADQLLDIQILKETGAKNTTPRGRMAA